MSFPKYEAYKDSGVEWLGEVPEHWDVFSLKRSVEGCVNGIWGNEPDEIHSIPVIRVADFNREVTRVSLDKLTYRSIVPKDRESRLLQAGDLLIEKSGGGEKTLVGCVVLFEHEFDAVTSNFVARMRPNFGFDSNFLCYAFNALYQGRVHYPSIKQTTGIQNLDTESYLQEYFCFPTPSEQTQIAHFLDHETARIDALITEQQRLIELLKEKRQAVISHAVTKGLDPTAPMKDSGVEWLGEVPEHWEICFLKHYVSTINGFGFSSSDFQDEGVPFIRAGNIKSKSITQPEIFLSREIVQQYKRVILKSGDVVISMVGSDPKILESAVGQVGIIPGSLAGSVPNQNVVILRENAQFLLKKFLFYSLLSSAYRHHLNVFSHKLANQSIISSLLLVSAKFSYPSLDRQQEIVDYLDHETTRIDALIAEAYTGISLLQERRSALISAAVTGQIDVRGWQAPVSPVPTLEAAYG